MLHGANDYNQDILFPQNVLKSNADCRHAIKCDLRLKDFLAILLHNAILFQFAFRSVRTWKLQVE